MKHEDPLAVRALRSREKEEKQRDEALPRMWRVNEANIASKKVAGNAAWSCKVLHPARSHELFLKASDH